MSAIVRYLAGGALALSSQGFFAVSFGLPSVMTAGAGQPVVMQLQAASPFERASIASLQKVDRTRKGDRLPAYNAAPDPAVSNEHVAGDRGLRKPVQPSIKPAKRDVEPKLPEGCSASISPLADRVAANQAGNCITALEMPYKVASAE
jgi:hypothetical protein